MTHEPQDLAPLGHPAEAEVPRHTADLEQERGEDGDTPVEDTLAYELAVEDGSPMAPQEGQTSTATGAPEFREPGA